MLKKIVTSVSDAFDINKATLTGCVDVIVVKQKDGTLLSTPFHLRFGKLKVLHTKTTEVSLHVNGEKTGVIMRLGKEGEGFFEIDTEVEVNSSSQDEHHLLSSSDEEDIIEKKHWFWGRTKSKDASSVEELVEDNKSEGIMKKVTNMFKANKTAEKSKPKNPNGIPEIVFTSVDENDKKVTELDLNEEGLMAADWEGEDEQKIGLSLCADQITDTMNEEQIIKVFRENLISFENYATNPSVILADKRLMVRIYDNLYSSEEGIPQIISLLAFGKFTELFEKPTEHCQPQIMTDEDCLQTEQIDEDSQSIKSTSTFRTTTRKTRSYIPTPNILKRLNLLPGKNVVKYMLKDGGFTDAHIYLYNSDAKIIISDIDGTITKSDVLGHIMPMIGRDWSQEGICELFTNLASNGYQLVYLTARAIGQAGTTQKYVRSVRQGEFSLPDGPLLMSPDRLFSAFKREIILRKPEVFKIACLGEIKDIFGDENHQPILGGFGNKSTDAIAYRAVGIPKNKIFIVNPQGEIYQEDSTCKWSYKKINEIVDLIFPQVETLSESAYYDSNYWRIENELEQSEAEKLMAELLSGN